LWAYIFTIKLGFGIQGIGIAGTITNSIVLILLLILSNNDPEVSKACILPDSRSLYGLWELICISIPLIFSGMIDWGTFEIMIFTSGFFGVIDQAAQIIMMSIAMFLYDFSYGLNDAAAAIIGK